MIKYCFHNLKICHQIYQIYLLPWAAHMSKNWKSISEIWHPLFNLLCVYCLFGTTVLFWNSPVDIFIYWLFFCSRLIRDSHLFGGQEYLVWKRRSNLAQFWFSKSMSKISQIFLNFFIVEYENGRTNLFLSFLITLIFYVL